MNVVSANFRVTSAAGQNRLAAMPSSVVYEELRRCGVSEGVWLSTCNRSEVIFRGPSARVRELVSAWSGEDSLESFSGDSALDHLYRVGSGLESASLGESEIVAQVKSAWAEAEARGMIRDPLNRALQGVLRTSKRVRTETGITRGVVSYATLAVREVSARIAGFAGKRVGVLGAGAMAERVIRELGRTPPASLVVWSRSAARAARFGVESGDLADARREWGNCDAIFTCLAAEFSGVGAGPVVADLGVPPNVDPSVSTIGMPELMARCAANSSLRIQAVQDAERIIAEELARFRKEQTRKEAFRSRK